MSETVLLAADRSPSLDPRGSKRNDCGRQDGPADAAELDFALELQGIRVFEVQALQDGATQEGCFPASNGFRIFFPRSFDGNGDAVHCVLEVKYSLDAVTVKALARDASVQGRRGVVAHPNIRVECTRGGGQVEASTGSIRHCQIRPLLALEIIPPYPFNGEAATGQGLVHCGNEIIERVDVLKYHREGMVRRPAQEDLRPLGATCNWDGLDSWRVGYTRDLQHGSQPVPESSHDSSPSVGAPSGAVCDNPNPTDGELNPGAAFAPHDAAPDPNETEAQE